MGVINKIREKTGLVIGLVAFSLILFLLGADFFSPNTGIFGSKSSNVVAEIDGQKVDLTEYQSVMDKMIYNFSVNAQRNPDDNDMRTIRQQVWSTLINDIAYKNQYEAVGVAVSERELTDMVQGSNIAQEVRSAFTDPKTGVFDKNNVISTLKRIADAPIDQQAAWSEFEQGILKNRERTKYFNLLSSTNYATNAEAENQQGASSSLASVKYLYVPFHTVVDSTIEVSEAELQTYLKNHGEEYQKEESRGLKYVSFPVQASAEDVRALEEEMNQIKVEFTTTKNDSIFAGVNSEKDNFYTAYTGDNLPPSLKTEDLEIGNVYGPYRIANEHYLYKVTDINNEGTASARASHILFKWDNEDDKASTKAEARKILRKLKNGEDFNEMARLHGTDGTASKGGDLGYFGEGQMVPEFEEAVFKATKEGLLRDVVETQFGYHIIKVTALKSNQQFVVASVVHDIYASDKTRNAIYRRSEVFASKCTSLDQMIANAKEEQLSVREAKNLGPNTTSIQGLKNNSRRLVTWLYRDAELNNVSEVFDLDDSYVIAAMSSSQEKGTSNLTSVRNEVERKVKNEKKAQVIIDKLSALTGGLEEIKEAYGSGPQVNEMSGLALNANSLNSVGFAPEAVGKVFSLKEGDKTEPFGLDNGVIILELISKSEASVAGGNAAIKKQIADKRKSSIPYAVNKVIEESASIEDNRYKFF